MDTQLVGTAHSLQTQGRHRRISFTYDQQWLANPAAFPISPEMPLDTGRHEPAIWKNLPFAFDDAVPDRWGRDLLQAEHRRKARASGQRWEPLDDLGLLLAVDDTTRQGALRFRVEGTFVAPPTAQAIHHELSTLRDAAAKFEESGEIDESVEHLIAVGSSPGGAAPKTWVIGDDGQMWLAKFARISDRGDVSAWEHVATILQRQAGISVQDSRIIRYDPHESIFLTRRFDRHGDTRIPYQSFKTMFRLHDGERKDYATLAREISQISANPPVDGQELFARAAFGVMVNNIDDHMQNHGLVRIDNGWRLAPSFDVNPERHGFSDTPLTSEDDPANSDLRLLVEHAEDFHLTRVQAAHRLGQIAQSVASWADVARKVGINPDEIRVKSAAFDERHRQLAHEIAASSTTSPLVVVDDVRSGDVWVEPHIRGGRKVEGHWRRRG